VYSSLSTAMSDDRRREWREEAARDRLVIQALRARREAAAPGAGPRRRRWPRWWARRTAAARTAQRVPADATPDQWASALSMDVAVAARGPFRAVSAVKPPAGR
jgi:hypothetical protein